MEAGRRFEKIVAVTTALVLWVYIELEWGYDYVKPDILDAGWPTGI